MFDHYFFDNPENSSQRWTFGELHSCAELMECVQAVGFLPLLDSGVAGYSAEGLMAEECRYVEFDDGSWKWPLWQWKGPAVTEGDCVYGKFFAGKAGFVSRRWWPHLCNWRRSQTPEPKTDSIEDVILCVLREQGSMITRDLRKACGFTGSNMRSRFDGYITRLQMSCRIVTENFVYPRDRHGREYGFGWALLTTPELLLGADAMRCGNTPSESYSLMCRHLQSLLPHASPRQIEKLIK